MSLLRSPAGALLGAAAFLLLLTGLLLVSGCDRPLVAAWDRLRCDLPEVPRWSSPESPDSSPTLASELGD